MTNIVLTSLLSALVALATIFVTNYLTRRRELEADWRKLKLVQYQNLIVSFSGIEKSRYTEDTLRVFTDAVNAMSLIGSPSVLRALDQYLKANAYNHPGRNDAEIAELYNLLIHALRDDIGPSRGSDKDDLQFSLLSLPQKPSVG